MRPSKYTQQERRAATLAVMGALRSAEVLPAPTLKAILGWTTDDTARLLWALVAAGLVVRGDVSKPFVSYALPENRHLLSPPKIRAQQDWASMVTALAA